MKQNICVEGFASLTGGELTNILEASV